MTASTIQWTTGVPTKPGRYIVTVTSPYGNLYTSIDIFDGLRWEYYNNNSIVAFCSTFDIQPYEPQQ